MIFEIQFRVSASSAFDVLHVIAFVSYTFGVINARAFTECTGLATLASSADSTPKMLARN